MTTRTSVRNLERMNPIDEAVILAGGFGTRLRSVLTDKPKPLAPIHGQPFLRILIDRLRRQGIQRVILSVGYMKESIRCEFEAEVSKGEVLFVEEESPLGTGGALVGAAQAVQGEHFFALNGDTFAPFDLRALSLFHLQKSADITIGSVQRSNNGRYGTLVLEDDQVEGFIEKSQDPTVWINAGTYVMRKSVLVSEGERGAFSLEREFLGPRVKSLKILAYCSNVDFLDLGLPEDLIAAQNLLPHWLSKENLSP